MWPFSWRREKEELDRLRKEALVAAMEKSAAKEREKARADAEAAENENKEAKAVSAKLETVAPVGSTIRYLNTPMKVIGLLEERMCLGGKRYLGFAATILLSGWSTCLAMGLRHIHSTSINFRLLPKKTTGRGIGVRRRYVPKTPSS